MVYAGNCINIAFEVAQNLNFADQLSVISDLGMNSFVMPEYAALDWEGNCGGW